MVPQTLRARVETRAQQRCEYCRAPQFACGYRFHLEHVIPSVAGGSNDFENRALACAACNLTKNDQVRCVDPQTNELVDLFNPRTDRWDKHFEWTDQSIAGRTPQGRATVAALALNDGIRLAARRLWFDAGLLP